MHPELVMILATERRRDLHAEAERERLAARLCARHTWRAALGTGLVRLGLRLAPAARTELVRWSSRRQQPRPAC